MAKTKGLNLTIVTVAIILVVGALGGIYLIGSSSYHTESSTITTITTTITPTSSCVASPGYLCGFILYPHTTGTIIVTIGQSTGATWAVYAVEYVPPGSANSQGIPAVSSAALVAGAGSLASGDTATFNLPVIAPGASTTTGAVPVGTAALGSLWVAYCPATPCHSPYYAQIATINATAT